MELSGLHTQKKLWGMTVYDIIDGNCLNGLSVNNDHKGNTMNEILRAQKNKEGNDISGNYIVAYIEPWGEAYTGTLEISGPTDNGSYEFDWDIKSDIKFKGVGFKIGGNKLSVIYWQTN